MTTRSSPLKALRSAGIDWLAGLGLAALLLVVYIASPQRRFLDSKYALLTSQAILEHGSFDLAPYLGAVEAPAAAAPASEAEAEDEEGIEIDEAAPPEPARKRRLPYQAKVTKGRILYIFSPGTALLSVPAVAIFRAAGFSASEASGGYSGLGERQMQGHLAAWLTAATCLLIYRAARRELPVPAAAAVALVAGLGSGLWSAASRVMWTHTWSSLLIAAAWLELLRWEDGKRPRGWFLGALMAALFWVRPTGAVLAAAVALYVALRHRRALAGLLLAGAAGFLLYIAYSYFYWGTLFPSYFRGVGGRLLHERPLAPYVFFELLISPGHGLFAFSPILLLVAWWLARHGVAPERRALALLAGGSFLAYVLLYSRWGWGGTVGPRFLCDPVALLAWLGAHAWRQRRAARRGDLRRFPAVISAAIAALLVTASFAGHGAVALDGRVPGRSRLPPGASPPTEVPYFEKGFWHWRSLPQLRLPELLAHLAHRQHGDLDRRRVRDSHSALSLAALSGTSVPILQAPPEDPIR